MDYTQHQHPRFARAFARAVEGMNRRGASEHRRRMLAGLHGRVSPAQWQRVCTHLREGLRGANPVAALQGAIDEVSSLIEGHFPAAARSEDDALPDTPQILG